MHKQLQSYSVPFPPEHNMLVVTLNSHASTNNLDFVIGQVLNEENRQKNDGTVTASDTVSCSGLGVNGTLALYSGTHKVVDRSRFKCFKCGELGHFQTECTKLGLLITMAPLNIASPAVQGNFTVINDNTNYYTF